MKAKKVLISVCPTLQIRSGHEVEDVEISYGPVFCIWLLGGKQIMSAAASEHIEKCRKSPETIKTSQLKHQNRFYIRGSKP